MACTGPKATPDHWIATAALSFIGTSIITRVAIGLRWPFALQVSPAQETMPERSGRG
jgi:hypothetical protein